MLAVEKALRRRPFNKILSIAWKKVYPNSQITSMPSLEVWKLRKKNRRWKNFVNHINFVVWGGERYDNLKSIIDSLSKSEVSNQRQLVVVFLAALFIFLSFFSLAA